MANREFDSWDRNGHFLPARHRREAGAFPPLSSYVRASSLAACFVGCYAGGRVCTLPVLGSVLPSSRCAGMREDTPCAACRERSNCRCRYHSFPQSASIEGREYPVSMSRPCVRFRPWHDNSHTFGCIGPLNLGQGRGLRTGLDRRIRGQRWFATYWARTLLSIFGYLAQFSIRLIWNFLFENIARPSVFIGSIRLQMALPDQTSLQVSVLA